MTRLLLKNNPILSFDLPEFFENGEMMSREQILSRLAKEHYILHSMPPLDKDKSTSYYNGQKEIFPNLFLYRNPKWLPHLYKFQLVNRVFDFLRRLHRKHIIKKLAEKRPILYIWHPIFSEEIGKYDEVCVIYHIYDDYQNYEGADRFDIRKREQFILKTADIIISTSKSLAEKKEAECWKKVFFIPHGIDYKLYEKCRLEGAVCPQDMMRIKRPRIGYIGRFNVKVDIELLQFIATNRPEWNLILVGPVSENMEEINKVKNLGNVFFLGSRNPLDLPNYYMNMDVNLLSYRFDNKLWYSSGHPLKMYEVLAAAKPVVATPLPEILKFKDFFHFARTRTEWIDCIQCCINEEQSNEIIQKRMDEAKKNTWDDRVELIKQLLQQKNR